MTCLLNSLPNDKMLAFTELKAFADDKLVIYVCDRVENIVGKGENAGYQHFLLFPQCSAFSLFPTMFSIALFFKVVKPWDCVVRG